MRSKPNYVVVVIVVVVIVVVVVVVPRNQPLKFG